MEYALIISVKQCTREGPPVSRRTSPCLVSSSYGRPSLRSTCWPAMPPPPLARCRGVSGRSLIFCYEKIDYPADDDSSICELWPCSAHGWKNRKSSTKSATTSHWNGNVIHSSWDKLVSGICQRLSTLMCISQLGPISSQPVTRLTNVRR